MDLDLIDNHLSPSFVLRIHDDINES